jgi:hypothetical protein
MIQAVLSAEHMGRLATFDRWLVENGGMYRKQPLALQKAHEQDSEKGKGGLCTLWRGWLGLGCWRGH